MILIKMFFEFFKIGLFAIGGGLAYLLIWFLYKGIEGNKDIKICAFILNADARNAFKKK